MCLDTTPKKQNIKSDKHRTREINKKNLDKHKRLLKSEVTPRTAAEHTHTHIAKTHIHVHDTYGAGESNEFKCGIDQSIDYCVPNQTRLDVFSMNGDPQKILPS